MSSEQTAMARVAKTVPQKSDGRKAPMNRKKSKADLQERFAKVAKLGAVSNNQVLTRLVVAYCVS